MKAARDYTNKMIQLEKERSIAWKAAMFADDDSPEYAHYQAAKDAIQATALEYLSRAIVNNEAEQ